MHELTRNDIRLYVEDTLGDNKRFQQLRQDDPHCPDFVWNIVTEADGVFLWVFLVTRSLLDGLTNSDRIKDLHQRVNETPKDLQDYFKTILFSTENRYRTQTARIFTIAVNAVSELPLMAYWVIDQEETNYMLQLPVETPPENILRSRLANMERRLKSLSKGLLETRKNGYVALDSSSEDSSYHDMLFGFEVDFLHRTVKDYLQTPDAQLMLQTWSNENFNTELEICTALGALVKMAPHTLFEPYSGIWYTLVPFFASTLRLDQDLSRSAELASLLDELQISIVPAIRHNKTALDKWLTEFLDLNVELQEKGMIPDLCMISACVVFGVSNYVTEKFIAEPQLCQRVATHFPSLIWSIIVPRYSLPAGSSEVSMLELMLTHGVDPNKSFGGHSEWRLFLEIFTGREEERLKMFDCVKVMLRHGAKFNQHCSLKTETANGKREARADELLKEWFDADQFGVLQDIVKRRERKNKKSETISKKLRHLQLWIKSKK
jgi:hypothetical protein